MQWYIKQETLFPMFHLLWECSISFRLCSWHLIMSGCVKEIGKHGLLSLFCGWSKCDLPLDGRTFIYIFFSYTVLKKYHNLVWLSDCWEYFSYHEYLAIRNTFLWVFLMVRRCYWYSCLSVSFLQMVVWRYLFLF